MTRIALALAAAAALAAAPLQAKQPAAVTGSSIPVAGTTSTGDTFAGTFNLQQFATDNGKVVAVGTIAGTLTNAAGQVVGSALQTVSLPVTVNCANTSTTSSAISAAAASCAILHLDLGPLSLNVLGLQVNLSRVVLDITAVPGAGNLLGNLLCSVANLLNNPSGLADLLNQILGILQGL